MLGFVASDIPSFYIQQVTVRGIILQVSGGSRVGSFGGVYIYIYRVVAG